MANGAINKKVTITKAIKTALKGFTSKDEDEFILIQLHVDREPTVINLDNLSVRDKVDFIGLVARTIKEIDLWMKLKPVQQI